MRYTTLPLVTLLSALMASKALASGPEVILAIPSEILVSHEGSIFGTVHLGPILLPTWRNKVHL